jgi:hypothetical protein
MRFRRVLLHSVFNSGIHLIAGRSARFLINVAPTKENIMTERNTDSTFAQNEPSPDVEFDQFETTTELGFSFNAKELMDADLPPLKWIVPGLLPVGLTLFAGRPKIGKSLMMGHIATELSLGGQILSQFNVEPQNVLYYALEDGPVRLQQRMGIALQGRRPSENMQIVLQIGNLKEKGIDQIEKYLTQNPDTSLVILDTLGSASGEKKGTNDPFGADYLLVQRMQQLALSHNLAIVIIHHLRKPMKGVDGDVMDEIAGTTGLTAAADTLMALVNSKDGRLQLHARGRDLEEKVFDISTDIEAGNWEIVGEGMSSVMSSERREIFDVINDSPEPIGPQKISELLRKSSKSEQNAVRKLLQKLVIDGLISKSGWGKYTAVRVRHSGHSGHNSPLTLEVILNSTFEELSELYV